MKDTIAAIVVVMLIVVVLLCFGAHIVACMKAGAVFMLLLGIFFFPYGVIHGLGYMFGWWM